MLIDMHSEANIASKLSQTFPLQSVIVPPAFNVTFIIKHNPMSVTKTSTFNGHTLMVHDTLHLSQQSAKVLSH